MPTAKKQYRLLRGLTYPADAEVCRLITEGDHEPRKQGQCGEAVRYEKGAIITKGDLPAGVFDACFRRGALEPVKSAKSEDAPDGA